MKFRYGSFEHDSGEVSLVSYTQEIVRNERGGRDRIRRSMTVRGTRQASTQAAIKNEVETIEAAYGDDNQDAGFLHDNGDRSGWFFDTGESISGVKIGAVNWVAENAAYATGATFEIPITAEYLPADSSGDNLLSWREQLVFIGTTGPMFAHVPLLRGPAQKQTIRQRSLQTVIQSGEAVGRRSYPTVPPPMFPQAEKLERRESAPGTPQRDGKGFTNFPWRWTYHFESAFPLNGLPTPR